MYVNVTLPTDAPWPGAGPVGHDLRMARVRPPLARLVTLPPTGVLAAGCHGTAT